MAIFYVAPLPAVILPYWLVLDRNHEQGVLPLKSGDQTEHVSTGFYSADHRKSQTWMWGMFSPTVKSGLHMRNRFVEQESPSFSVDTFPSRATLYTTVHIQYVLI